MAAGEDDDDDLRDEISAAGCIKKHHERAGSDGKRRMAKCFLWKLCGLKIMANRYFAAFYLLLPTGEDRLRYLKHHQLDPGSMSYCVIL